MRKRKMGLGDNNEGFKKDYRLTGRPKEEREKSIGQTEKKFQRNRMIEKV